MQDQDHPGGPPNSLPNTETLAGSRVPFRAAHVSGGPGSDGAAKAQTRHGQVSTTDGGCGWHDAVPDRSKRGECKIQQSLAWKQSYWTTARNTSRQGSALAPLWGLEDRPHHFPPSFSPSHHLPPSRQHAT